MTFLNPILAVAGLACIALPIIIHILMRRRRRPVSWGAMKFLQEAYRRQRRRLNLEQVLLLASRCLLLALLALALGKPILGAAGLLAQGGPRTVYLLVDNSLTASATSGETQDIESVKARAIALLDGLDQARGDRAAVVTLGGPFEERIMPPASDIEAAKEVVRSLRPTASRAEPGPALSRVREEAARAGQETGGAAVVALLTAGRTGSLDVSQPAPALGAAGVRFVAMSPASSPADNVAITAVDPGRRIVVTGGAAGPSELPVRISLRRSGAGLAGSAVTKVSARVADPSRSAEEQDSASEATIAWNPGQDAAAVTLAVRAVEREGDARRDRVLEVRIDRDAIEADNLVLTPLESRTKLKVALVAPLSGAVRRTIDAFTPEDWLGLALAPEEDDPVRGKAGQVEVRTIDPGQVSAVGGGALLRGFDVIAVTRPDLLDAQGWQRVRESLRDGAMLLVTPPSNEVTHTWFDGMASALGLGWTVSREAQAFAPAATLSADRTGSGTADPLALVPELADLVRPVTVSRALRIEEGVLRPGAAPFDVVLRLSDGSPLIVLAEAGEQESGENGRAAARGGGGLVCVWLASPDLAWTDLPTKPLMVPLVQELVRQGVSRSIIPRSFIAGRGVQLPRGAAELLALSGDGAALRVDASGRPTTPVRHAGAYRVRGSDGASLGVVAVNADTGASATDPTPPEAIERWLSGAGVTVEWLKEDAAAAGAGEGSPVLPDEDPREPISLPLLIAAAVVALIEVVMARVFSHAKRDGAERQRIAEPAGGARA